MPWRSKSATATIGRVTLDTMKSRVIWTPCQVASGAPVAVTARGILPSIFVFAHVHQDLGHVDMQAPESIMMRTPASPATFST
eukprot:731806-Heterocapsa_arctica.AAC.1